MQKIRVGIIFGGQSSEHEVSLMSAKNVIAAIDKNKYDVTKISIPKTGDFNFNSDLIGVDVVFPVLHGTNGEDGTIQGFLKLAGIPFVGASVLGSAIGMDKDVQKRLLRDARISTAKFTTDLTNPFDYPVFVKPANAGSSVGVHKVKSYKVLKEAVKDALKYDSKVLIEEAIVGREIEVAVLGNANPIASLPGEVISNHEFYDYDAKYVLESKTEIPAKLTKTQIKKIITLAIKTYKVLCCEGMARVDMFLTKSNKIIVNEINTIPGFTKISMYPKLWEASGISYSELLDKLIQLALERFKKEQKLQISR